MTSRAWPPRQRTGSPGESAGWMSRGRCAEVDPELFFPEQGEDGSEAKRVCRGCEVRTACRSYAMDHGELRGVWGGRTEAERDRARMHGLAA